VAAVTELELLSAWESGCGRPTPDRAVTLAAAASGLPFEEVAELPLGACDRLLLQLREQCFGARLDGLAECPRCAAELEVGIEVDELRVRGAGGARTVTVGGRSVRLRALTNRDVQSCDADRDLLLTRCIIAEPGAAGESVTPSRTLLDAVEAELDALDPQAAVAVNLDCPSCGAGWPASVHITEFVWGEVDRFARRLLYDVHTLATAYGWREADVLAVSPVRRRFYLQVCGA
jgi:hypothetical protein